jgi:hypothetical protein
MRWVGYLGLFLLAACTGATRARKYGLETPGPFHDGVVRGSGLGEFAYDKWFEVKGVSLPAAMLNRSHEANVLDCLRPGTDRYVVVFRSYVALSGKGPPTATTFYVMIRRTARGELDPSRGVISVLADGAPAASSVWSPGQVAIQGNRLSIEARARDLGEAPAHFEIEGRSDEVFGWEDYVKRRRETAVQAGDDPSTVACRL